MAKMFPQKPRQISKYSKEDIMFNSLEKLPDDYCVFHSFSIISTSENTISESETDFVVFHPQKGIMCIEAKAGKNISYKDNCWYYGNGKEMSHGGPFLQAQSNKYELIKTFKNYNLHSIISRCKFIHAVWFPDVTDEALNSFLPCDADRNLLLTQKALYDPKTYIDKIFDIQINNVETNLSETDVNVILKRVLCPSFNLAATSYSDRNYKELVYNQLIKEQMNILNYLEEQKTAIINGAAGTGKTFIALEKARRCAECGDKVLFLCFNALLRDYLKSSYKNENIDFYTIDELAYNLTSSIDDKDKYKKLSEKLLDYVGRDDFYYSHIVIDEGQDFGREEIEESDVIEILKEIIVRNPSKQGTFYIFYDKNQMINSKKIPSYLYDADCKLTLYQNCRNTRDIAITSTRVLGDNVRINVYHDFVDTTKPVLYIANGENAQLEAIDKALKRMKEAYKNIVILTCTTVEKSILKNYLINNKYKNTQFTTCRKFKGLEADAIILTDITFKTFKDEPLIFYTGSSRAKFDLAFICDISEDECSEILDSLGTPPSNRNIMHRFKSKMNVELA